MGCLQNGRSRLIVFAFSFTKAKISFWTLIPQTMFSPPTLPLMASFFVSGKPIHTLGCVVSEYMCQKKEKYTQSLSILKKKKKKKKKNPQTFLIFKKKKKKKKKKK